MVGLPILKTTTDFWLKPDCLVQGGGNDHLSWQDVPWTQGQKLHSSKVELVDYVRQTGLSYGSFIMRWNKDRVWKIENNFISFPLHPRIRTAASRFKIIRIKRKFLVGEASPSSTKKHLRLHLYGGKEKNKSAQR